MADEQRFEVQDEADLGGSGTETAASGELHALLEDARTKADEHWNQCLRLQAEIDNLHKRNRRDLENAHKYALEKFASDLLPVRDSLEMGIAAANQGQNVDPAKLIEGSELTLKILGSVMEKFGIAELDPQGERFNPQLHEAMSTQPRADVEPNTVVTVVQKGYLLNDRLIRPAMVIVSKAAPDAPPSAGGGIDLQA
ncbi:MAG: nucleotide exchange factor GrpE [Gammaproteobacteria bacterium]